MHLTEDNKKFLTMQIYGYFLGGIIPLSIFFGIEYFIGQGIGDKEMTFFTLFTLFLSIWQTFTIYFFIVERAGVWFWILYGLQPYITFMFLHLFIVFINGGAFSILAGFEYAYVPLTVLAVYGLTKNTWGAFLGVFVSVLPNLLALNWQVTFFTPILHFPKSSAGDSSQTLSSMHNSWWMYLGTLAIQLYAGVRVYTITQKWKEKP